MKSLKTLIFASLFLFLCLGNAFAETCYSPGYGNYECEPYYQGNPYPYADDGWGGDFFGVVIGGGGYYGGNHGGNWHGDHGNHGGGGGHRGGGGGGHHHH